LRSEPLLLGGVIVKNGTGFAKRRLVVRAVISQIFHKADQPPCQHETKAQQQKQSDCDIHGVHRKLGGRTELNGRG
jgi:hypothetical protein